MDRKNLLSAIITAAALTALFIYANLAWADAGVENPRNVADAGMRNALRTLERSRFPAYPQQPAGFLVNAILTAK